MEDLTSVEPTTAEGKPKTALEILIERINNIQNELSKQTEARLKADEIAFTEAAEAYVALRKTGFINRK